MIACRSPVPFLPPSILVLLLTGYFTRSDSAAYAKRTFDFVADFFATVTGMPYGYSPRPAGPKSGCRFREPIAARHALSRLCTGRCVTGVFHTLFSGNNVQRELLIVTRFLAFAALTPAVSTAPATRTSSDGAKTADDGASLRSRTVSPPAAGDAASSETARARQTAPAVGDLMPQCYQIETRSGGASHSS